VTPPTDINKLLHPKSTTDRLLWAWETYKGKLAITSSFQTQSVALLHLISQSIPDIPVLFLDTGFHFPETLEFRDQLQEQLQLNIINVKPDIGHEGFRNSYGNLYLTDPDLCCHINKTAPLQKTLQQFDGWITGVRADQTKQRAEMKLFNLTDEGKVKICPILDWTRRDVWSYIDEHKLPEHPLFHKGFMSVGCAPCTRPVLDPNDERSGRWADSCKTECGIHTDDKNKNT